MRWVCAPADGDGATFGAAAAIAEPVRSSDINNVHQKGAGNESGLRSRGFRGKSSYRSRTPSGGRRPVASTVLPGSLIRDGPVSRTGQTFPALPRAGLCPPTVESSKSSWDSNREQRLGGDLGSVWDQEIVRNRIPWFVGGWKASKTSAIDGGCRDDPGKMAAMSRWWLPAAHHRMSTPCASRRGLEGCRHPSREEPPFVKTIPRPVVRLRRRPAPNGRGPFGIWGTIVGANRLTGPLGSAAAPVRNPSRFTSCRRLVKLLESLCQEIFIRWNQRGFAG